MLLPIPCMDLHADIRLIRQSDGPTRLQGLPPLLGAPVLERTDPIRKSQHLPTPAPCGVRGVRNINCVSGDDRLDNNNVSAYMLLSS